jgi:hypothetical protein
MKIGRALSAGLLLFGAASNAGAGQTTIGNWIVTTEADRFSEGNTVIALTAQEGGLFAVRCIQNTFSLAISNRATAGELKEGDLFKIKFRADNLPVVDTIGEAINNSVIEVLTTPEMRGELTIAREYALRVTSAAGTTFDSVFKAGFAAKALPPVLRACPQKKDE